jgi:hypothetical protein
MRESDADASAAVDRKRPDFAERLKSNGGGLMPLSRRSAEPGSTVIITPFFTPWSLAAELPENSVLVWMREKEMAVLKIKSFPGKERAELEKEIDI